MPFFLGLRRNCRLVRRILLLWLLDSDAVQGVTNHTPEKPMHYTQKQKLVFLGTGQISDENIYQRNHTADYADIEPP